MKSRTFNWGAIFAVGVRLTGWLSINTLASAGVIGTIALALGGFSLPRTMAQLANLTDRYVAANAARQGQFNHIVLCGFVLALLAISFFRRSGFARALKVSDHD